MWPDSRLTRLLGLDHPIVQSPMLGSAGPALAAEVCRAGALGSVACGAMPAEDARRIVARMRQATDRPFNVNFFVQPAARQHPPPPDAAEALAALYAEHGLGRPGPPGEAPAMFGDDHVAMLEDLRPAVASFHFHLPSPARIDRLKAAGLVLMATAPTVADARRLAAAGIDVIVAQGWEAGGHRGSPEPTGPGDGVGTMALVPQVVDAVDVPVLAAGGIGDARGIAAALMLGAAGVQMGTAFLRCPEAETDAPRRALIAQATDTDTMVTDSVSGRPARGFRSAYAEAMAPFATRLPAFPGMYALARPIIDAAGPDAPERASFALYGQSAALAREEPAAELVGTLAADALRRLRGG